MTRIPEIIAHRGAPREALENTLMAFQLALDQGADGIELDVHATKDGVVVVHHDSVVRRLANGESSLVSISDLQSPEALAIPLSGGMTMPTLDDVLDLIGSRARIYVEVKAAEIEAPLVDCIDRHPTARIAVHAFDHRIPVLVRTKRPGTPIGLLSASYPISVSSFIQAAQPEALWQQAQLIDRALVDEAHSLGVRVIAWTENDRAHAQLLIAMGVDALCTDTPGLLRAALAL